MRTLLMFLMTLCLTACGYHLQGQTQLAPPLQRLYLQSPDPYGALSHNLQQALKLSHVQLTTSPADATTILAILSDIPSQKLLSVSGTQQTRQYQLGVTVTYEIQNAKGLTIIGPEALSETRTLTIQSNQILGSSNEATMLYQQMRSALAFAIMNRIASQEVTRRVNAAL
ncbi:MAG: hypothetical protein EPO11_00840 [Gammaproteobacteria bacterium]|nr:MAG: hypothetical protein EPO11_00840 [Gammaproteobacteria bacterium]